MRREDKASLSPLLGRPGGQQPRNYIDPATAYGTYQRVSAVRSSETEVLSDSSHNAAKKFECDGGTKSGRVLVMIFDLNGRPTLKEMSRHEVLRMTQQAAELKGESVVDDVSSPERLPPPLRRRSSSNTAASWRLGQQSRAASQQDLYAPVSVQVRVGLVYVVS